MQRASGSTASDRCINCFKRADYPRDQNIIRRIAEPDPNDWRPVGKNRSRNNKILILGDQDSAAFDSSAPDKRVTRRSQPYLTDMNGLVPEIA